MPAPKGSHQMLRAVRRPEGYYKTSSTCPVEVGDRVTITLGFQDITNLTHIRSKVRQTATVEQINHAKRWYRVSYILGDNNLNHECFKF